MEPLLIEIRKKDGTSTIKKLEDPREYWCEIFNQHPLNLEAGRTAHPVSSETRLASSKSLEA